MAIENSLTISRFRAQLDQLFQENEVLTFGIEEAKRLLDATEAGIWVYRRDRGAVERKVELVGDPRLAAQEELAQRCIRMRESSRAGSLLCVPMSEFEMVMGALTVRLPNFSRISDEVVSAFTSQVAAALRRVRLFQAFREITLTTTRALEVDRLLDTMMLEITNLGFTYAIISVADRYQRDIAAVRGRNVPPAWIHSATHPINSNDIVSKTYESGQPSPIKEGNDDSLDQRIYWRFDHDRLARKFVPILVENKALGVVEFGCDRSNRSTIFTEEKVAQACRIVERHARSEISLMRSYVLLETIAGHAIDALGADSASIYVYKGNVKDVHHPLPKPLLFGAAGKATPEFLTDYPPRTGGFGHYAMATSRLVWRQADVISREHVHLYRAGVQALAAIPLQFEEPDLFGVLYIHFWREHRIKNGEIEVARTFAGQAEVAIYNHLLIGRTKERYESAWSYSRVLNIVDALARSDLNEMPLQRVLDTIAGHVLEVLGADSVVLYEYLAAKNHFNPPVVKGYLKDREAVQKDMPSDGVAHVVLSERKASLFSPRAKEDVDLTRRRSERERFIVRENIESCAILLLKDKDVAVGIMFVNYRDPQTFENREEMETLARSAAIAINSNRDREESRWRVQKEIDAIRMVQEAVAHSNLKKFPLVLQSVLQKTSDIISARWGFIMWIDSNRTSLRSLAHTEPPPPGVTFPIRQAVTDGVVGLVAREGKSRLSADVTTDDELKRIYVEKIPGFRSELAVPILYFPGEPTSVIGVINCEAETPGMFDEADLAFVEAVARHVVMAFRILERLTMTIRIPRLIELIRERIGRGELDIEGALRVVLTGVTADEGLGFSRAMLFLKEPSGQLKGRLAIGALDRREAEAVWRELDLVGAASNPEPAHEVGEGRSNQAELNFTRLLDVAVAADAIVPLTAFIQAPETSAVVNGDGKVSACAGEGCVQRIPAGDENLFAARLRTAAGVNAVPNDMMCVPLRWGGEVLGVLVVDNEFLPPMEPALRRLRRGDEPTTSALMQFADLIAELVSRDQSAKPTASGAV